MRPESRYEICSIVELRPQMVPFGVEDRVLKAEGRSDPTEEDEPALPSLESLDKRLDFEEYKLPFY